MCSTVRLFHVPPLEKGEAAVAMESTLAVAVPPSLFEAQNGLAPIH